MALPADLRQAGEQHQIERIILTVGATTLVQPRLTKSRAFSGRPTRGNSYIEGTRPVRSGLPPPPSSPANLDREETRAGFPYGFRGFCRSRCTARRAGRAQRGTLSAPVSSLDFRGERLRRRPPHEPARVPQFNLSVYQNYRPDYLNRFSFMSQYASVPDSASFSWARDQGVVPDSLFAFTSAPCLTSAAITPGLALNPVTAMCRGVTSAAPLRGERRSESQHRVDPLLAGLSGTRRDLGEVVSPSLPASTPWAMSPTPGISSPL